jgi:hypothetical protein
MATGTLGPEDEHWWEYCIERLLEGVTEIGIHPGWDEEWRRLETMPLVRRGRKYLDQMDTRLISFNEIMGRS